MSSIQNTICKTSKQLFLLLKISSNSAVIHIGHGPLLPESDLRFSLSCMIIHILLESMLILSNQDPSRKCSFSERNKRKGLELLALEYKQLSSRED